MNKKYNHAVPLLVLAALTVLFIIGTRLEKTRPVYPFWQLPPSTREDDYPAGVDSLAFCGAPDTRIIGNEYPDPGHEKEESWFRLTEDSESGILYAYVPSEMDGRLYLKMNSDQQLLIREKEGHGSAEAGTDGGSGKENSSRKNSKKSISGTFRSGEALPVFPENVHYSFSILDREGNTLESEEVVFLYNRNVPSMYIETESGSMEAIDEDKHHQTAETASYRIYLTDGTPDSSGICEIKGRGNSTWSQEKRPYNLNMETENVLLGMDSCRKYALIANFWDSTQTRQYYSFLAAERLGLDFTPQTQFVNLYLNGKYQSLYLLTQRLNVNGGTVKITDLDQANKKANPDQTEAEKRAEAAAEADAAAEAEAAKAEDAEKDTGGADEEPDAAAEEAEAEKKAEAAAETGAPAPPEPIVQETDARGHESVAYSWEEDPSDITGGYLLEMDERYKKEEVWFSTETHHFDITSPRRPTVGEFEYISAYVRDAEKALFADDWTNPDTGRTCFEYFDMDSWARMYLIQDFFVQSDDEFYSFFMYKKKGDPLLYCGPVWDFDLCLGNMNCGDYYRTSAQTLWLKDGRKRWLHHMGQDPEFSALVKKIYLEELEPIIRNILEKEYDKTVERLEPVTKINYLRWHKDLNYEERTGLVRDLLETRVQFLHDYYTDPGSFHRLLFHFAWDDFSYYVRDGEAMGFLPTWDYGEKQSSPQREANGFITGWSDADGNLLQADELIYEDREFDPVYIP